MMVLIDSNEIVPFYQFRFFTDVIWLDWYGGKKQFAVVSLAKSMNLNANYGARSVRSENNTPSIRIYYKPVLFSRICNDEEAFRQFGRILKLYSTE
jgi:hypothetical protein